MNAARDNPIRLRLRAAKQAAVESAVGKGEGWTRRVLDGEQGVMLDDILSMCEVLGLKVVDSKEVTVDAELLAAYATIVSRATADKTLLTGAKA